MKSSYHGAFPLPKVANAVAHLSAPASVGWTGKDRRLLLRLLAAELTAPFLLCFSPSAAPGSLQRASSLRRERSTRQLSTRQLAPPETPTRVSPRVVPLGAGQAAPETTMRVSPRVAPAGRSPRRENSSRGPPRRVAPEFAANPEPPGQAAATEAEAPKTAAAPLRRATSLRRERSSRKL